MEKLSSQKYMKAHYWFILFFFLFFCWPNNHLKRCFYFSLQYLPIYAKLFITQRQRLKTLLTFRAHRNAKFLLLSKVDNCFKNDFLPSKLMNQ